MSPKEVLQIAGCELDRLRLEIISCASAGARPVAAIESLTGRFVALRQELHSLDAPELREILLGILTKATRVQRLLEAGTAFHCHSMFGRAQTRDTYGSDGTFSTDQDSRIIFQG